MNGKSLVPLAFGVVAIAFLLFGNLKLNDAPLIRPEGPDMVRAFTENAQRTGAQARQDAEQFGAFCQAMHDYLKSDWESESYLKTGAQIDTMRVVGWKMRTAEQSLQQHYPILKSVLEQHFEKHVGKSGGPIDDSAKANWLKAWKELADSSKYAASQL